MEPPIKYAHAELANKTRKQIEEETAYRWAARAIAAFQLSVNSQQHERWMRDAADYYHEAVEHAALADESGDLLRRVRQWVHQHVPRGVL